MAKIKAAYFSVILVTCGSAGEAGKIADSLLRKRLIACANIISGVESRFWWNGRIDKARESLLMLKTKEGNFSRIEKEVKRLHSYEVQEIIAMPIIKGSGPYLKWVDEVC